MANIQIRDIHILETCDCEIVEHDQALDFHQFVQACGQNDGWVLALFEHDILQAVNVSPRQHRYLGEDLLRARRAYRLQRDFDASLTAVALMLDLIDEVHYLRKRVAK